MILEVTFIYTVTSAELKLNEAAQEDKLKAGKCEALH